MLRAEDGLVVIRIGAVDDALTAVCPGELVPVEGDEEGVVVVAVPAEARKTGRSLSDRPGMNARSVACIPYSVVQKRWGALTLNPLPEGRGGEHLSFGDVEVPLPGRAPASEGDKGVRAER